MMFNDMMHDLKQRNRLFRNSKGNATKKAFEFMINRSKQTGNEVAAAVLENGNVLVFKDNNSTRTESWSS